MESQRREILSIYFFFRKAVEYLDDESIDNEVEVQA